MKTKLIIGGFAILVLAVEGVFLLRAATPPANPQETPTTPKPGLQVFPTPTRTRGPAILAPTPLSISSATSTPTVGTPTVTPSIITVNNPTVVTVVATITDPTLIASGVNLLRLGTTGAQPTLLGVMHDDGQNGDVKSNDGVFTLQVLFSEASASQVQFQVSAAFKSLLRRVLSTVVTMPVWNTYTDPSSNVVLEYPPSLFVHPADSSNVLSIETSSKSLTAGAKPDDGSPSTDTGYAIRFYTRAYSIPLDFNTWLSQTYPNATSPQDVFDYGTVSGVPAYSALLYNDSPGAGQAVFVPRNGTMYILFYTSSNLTQEQDAAGLAAFQQILSSMVLK